jgi:hypothetical protein
MGDKNFRSWSLLSLERTTRHAQGDTGYADEIGACYAYDDKVANHGYVQIGDLVVVRERTMVIGAGWVDAIDIAPGKKIEPRCPRPACGSTNIKARRTLQPEFLCNKCGIPCAEPNYKIASVKVYTLQYGSRWRRADGYFPASQIDPFYVSRAVQNSIRELKADMIGSVIDAHLVTGASWWEPSRESMSDIPGGRKPTISYTRQGQQIFRECLLNRFGSVCAFTGANPPGALDAAHLYMFSGAPEHDLSGGLLLRCDLHALFDRDLITIDPDAWTIDLAPELHNYPALKALQNQPIRVPSSLRPRREYVERHATRARSTWVPRRGA